MRSPAIKSQIYEIRNSDLEKEVFEHNLFNSKERAKFFEIKVNARKYLLMEYYSDYYTNNPNKC
jgi:hypothetical protein